ncbi:MFS transporter [Robertkochia solimangrovi]|uniref:MFS transporter n=1 Tax=Robertkochia solimangrovi TaxID=2213046 RepID=UPI00117DFA51|nr:MFS transporter [Robertkochia solimangrovi]TRZ41890.1 MFS transporter [Robertkochia solimangrovi]
MKKILRSSNRKALIALAIGGFGIGMTEFVIMGILPDVAAALNISIPMAGHFIAAYALGVVVGAPLLTTMGSKLHSHRMLLLLMLWFTIFNSLSAFAGNYWTLLVLRFLSGLPHGAFLGIGAVVAGKLSKEGKAARAIATMLAGLTIANVIGVPLGTYFGHNYHWSVAFLIVGIVGILAMAGVYFWMPQMKSSSTGSFAQDMVVFKQPRFWALILLTMIGTGGFFAWYSYIAPLITEVAGHPENVVSYAMVITGFGMIAGNFLGARLAEKYALMDAVLISLIMMVTALIANAFLAEHKLAILVMTFIIGMIGFSLATPLQMAIINASKGSEMIGSSMNHSAFNMGNASGAYFAGLPIAMGYGFTSADFVGAILAGLGVLITCIIILRNNPQLLRQKFRWAAR